MQVGLCEQDMGGNNIEESLGQTLARGALNWFDSLYHSKKEKAPRWGAFSFGAGYGSRTRLHGLGNTKADFALYSLNRKKYSICNGFSVFSKW